MKVINASYAIVSDIDGTELLKQIEKVGRTCYKSEDKITDTSAVQFVKNIMKRDHLAIIEHNSVSVRFVCDRGVSHEIVRHRVASYGQESTRYCNYTNERFSSSINVIDVLKGIELDTKMKNLDPLIKRCVMSEWKMGMSDAEEHYNNMIKLGATPQIARSVLPTGLKTEIVVTMNLREWRHFFKLRTDIAAHPQMRELTIPLLAEFKSLIPIIFNDIKVGE